MPPMPTEWWLRPVSSAWRVGEQSAVVWKRLILQAVGREPLGGRRVARATEGARSAEADIVDQHDQHVRRAFRRAQRLDRRKLRVRILRVVGDEADPRLGSGIGRTLRDSLSVELDIRIFLGRNRLPFRLGVPGERLHRVIPRQSIIG